MKGERKGLEMKQNELEMFNQGGGEWVNRCREDKGGVKLEGKEKGLYEL